MKKLALVLGGGASKGYAHIGVIKVLEKNGIKPDLIVGTSMGAIIGGVYASGKNSEYLIEMSKKLSRNKLMDFNIFHAFFKTSVLRGKKLRKILYNEVGDITHKQLQIPFVAISTNLEEGKIEIMKEGKLLDSMLASSALPSIYPEIELNGKILCDGGLVNNVPDDVARKLGENYVVLSVDVIGDYKKQIENSKIKIISRIVNALTLMQTQITKYKGNSSDLRINISQPDVPQMGFNKKETEKSIEHGIVAMKNNLSKLKKLLED